MSGNVFGRVFRVTTFGESHGPAIGAVIDGCPAGLDFDYDFLAQEMQRRRPGQSHITTQRNEADMPEVLSGVFEGKTTGAPIALLVRNTDARSKDYEKLKDLYRPGHADFSWQAKYGLRDYRGGGRSSARETAARVAAGAVAKMLLKLGGIEIIGYVSAIGPYSLTGHYSSYSLLEAERNLVRCPDAALAAEMEKYIAQLAEEGDSTGGVVSCVVKGVPAGLGEPVFDKLEADLAKAIMSINATKGFETGAGFAAAALRGSEHSETIEAVEGGKLHTSRNVAGGIAGGISTGEDIFFRTAFKPVSTIKQPTRTVNTEGEATIYTPEGRHDPCVVPRAVPIVEAMAALTITDHLLQHSFSKTDIFHL